jgi:hypothetical protein
MLGLVPLLDQQESLILISAEAITSVASVSGIGIVLLILVFLGLKMLAF